MDVLAPSKLRTKSSSYKKDYKPQMTNNKGLKTTNFLLERSLLTSSKAGKTKEMAASM
jgi:hypothetical protein